MFSWFLVHLKIYPGDGCIEITLRFGGFWNYISTRSHKVPYKHVKTSNLVCRLKGKWFKNSYITLLPYNYVFEVKISLSCSFCIMYKILIKECYFELQWIWWMQLYWSMFNPARSQVCYHHNNWKSLYYFEYPYLHEACHRNVCLPKNVLG